MASTELRSVRAMQTEGGYNGNEVGASLGTSPAFKAQPINREH